MAKVITDSQNYTDIADAIRAKAGGTSAYKPNEMAAAIEAIPSGGGGGGETKTLLWTIPSDTTSTIGQLVATIPTLADYDELEIEFSYYGVAGSKTQFVRYFINTPISAGAVLGVSPAFITDQTASSGNLVLRNVMGGSDTSIRFSQTVKFAADIYGTVYAQGAADTNKYCVPVRIYGISH